MDDITALNILQKLNEWRKAGITSDVTLIIDKQEFHAHKNILIAAVHFFEKLFLGDFAEKGKNVITLKDVDPVGFRLILDYIYTKKIEIDDNNFESVLSVAAYYQIECLMKKLFDYVKNDIDSDNGFYYYHVVDRVESKRIKQFTKEFIQKDFLSCSNSNAFLDLIHPCLLEFIDSPVQKELDRFKIIMKWIQYDLIKRSDYLLDLIKHVDFVRISNDEIVEEILGYQLIINNSEIIQTINKMKRAEPTMWIYGMNESDLIRVGIINAEIVAIHIMAKTEMDYDEFQIFPSADAIYVSTFKKDQGNMIHRVKDSQWIPVSDNNNLPLANRSILYLEKYKTIYTINENDIYSYDLDTGLCSYKSVNDCKYNYKLCGSLVCYNDLIYTTVLCCNDLYCVLRYDPYTDNLHFMGRLLNCSNAVNAILDDKMFIISKSAVQMYDITKNECKIIEEEECDVPYHSMIGYQNQLYAIRDMWDVIDTFDPLKNEWTEVIGLKMNNINIFNKT